MEGSKHNKKESKVMLTTGSKRDHVYDNDNNWVHTRPKDVTYDDCCANFIELASARIYCRIDQR